MTAAQKIKAALESFGMTPVVETQQPQGNGVRVTLDQQDADRLAEELAKIGNNARWVQV